MGASGKAPLPTKPRLKREEYSRTKHDSAFSEWKILIGTSDWQDHAAGKEGAERYRTQNLPNCTSCPGVYELGIALSCPKSGRESGKLKPDSVIPVYLGQADNVRNRLQQYGREGAHLEKGCSNDLNSCRYVCKQSEPGLFKEVFSKGFSIVYRWAPMKTKRDAETTESQLLETFDYAWNKGSNGVRRPSDILKKLDRCPSTSRFPLIKKLQTLHHKKVGIKLKLTESISIENRSSIYTDGENIGIFSRVFKFGRSRPRLVPFSSSVDENYTGICGVALGHGSVCVRAPVKGRKRCAEHKGMKVNGSIRAEIKEEKLPTDGSRMKSDIVSGQQNGDFRGHVCGIILKDGSCCTNEPFKSNKRCLEHKGMRLQNSVLKSPAKKKDLPIGCSHELSSHPASEVQSRTLAPRTGLSKNHNAICGVALEDGTFCTRQPVIRRKRCEKHKGMRVGNPVFEVVETSSLV